MTTPRRDRIPKRPGGRPPAHGDGGAESDVGRNGVHTGGTGPPDAVATHAPRTEHLTDIGNARRVVTRHGADLRYVPAFKRFLAWDGRRWAPDEKLAVDCKVKETQAELFRQTVERLKELSKDAGDEDEARKLQIDLLKKLRDHLLKWEHAGRVKACVEMMKSEEGMPVTPEELDRGQFALNCPNGTLDLRTGQLRPHRREDLLTKVCRAEYDPAATCPLWERFLDRIMDGNRDLVTYLQRVAGYSLTGDVSEQVLFFLYGAGANGKSTFLGTLRELLGDYGCQAVSELLTAKATETHPTERADLVGRRFVATIETDEGKRLAEALMKQLTGGDALKARRLYQDFFEIRPTWKIFLAANHKPVIRGGDHAVWRRIKLVPFTVTISEEEKDKHLLAKLGGELAGILAWAVRGCLDWQKYGLGEPEEVRAATDTYRAEQDTIAGFVAECCFAHPNARARSSSLFDAYVTWSGDKLMTQKAFSQKLQEKGFPKKRGGGGVFFDGVGLQEVSECVGS